MSVCAADGSVYVSVYSWWQCVCLCVQLVAVSMSVCAAGGSVYVCVCSWCQCVCLCVQFVMVCMSVCAAGGSVYVDLVVQPKAESTTCNGSWSICPGYGQCSLYDCPVMHGDS